MKIGLSFLGDLLIFIGKIIITLGVFFQSNDHFEVLSQIDGPITNKILDIALIISYFVVGFVMIAGAGSNLNQQFGLPFWAVLWLALSLLLQLVSYMQMLNLFLPGFDCYCSNRICIILYGL